MTCVDVGKKAYISFENHKWLKLGITYGLVELKQRVNLTDISVMIFLRLQGFYRSEALSNFYL